MADTVVSSALEVQQWADDHFVEYCRANPFKQLMGTGINSVIQIKEDLKKEKGDKITFALVRRLTGDGQEDDNTLEGNEEKLGNEGHAVTVHQLRHGVVVGEYESIKTKIDLLDAAGEMLKIWNMEKLRDLCLARLLSPNIDSTDTYAASTATERNAWLAANNPATSNQRILFGAAKANYSGVHATDLANIDATNDDLHQDIVRLLKRMAQGCDPHIRPVMTDAEGASKERFILLCGSLAFRDLEANMDTILSNADTRGEDNFIFASGDLKIGNVIVKDIPEMDRAYTTSGGCLLENVGSGGTVEVEPVFLLGAQSLLLAWAQTTQARTDEFDYQNKRGVAVSEIRGCERATFNSFMHGVAVGYVSAAGD